jgi:hypothetical protein
VWVDMASRRIDALALKWFRANASDWPKEGNCHSARGEDDDRCDVDDDPGYPVQRSPPDV